MTLFQHSLGRCFLCGDVVAYLQPLVGGQKSFMGPAADCGGRAACRIWLW
jgi:hypothetical protein